MGAPIEQLAAAVFTECLPIVPAAVAVAGDVNLDVYKRQVYLHFCHMRHGAYPL